MMTCDITKQQIYAKNCAMEFNLYMRKNHRKVNNHPLKWVAFLRGNTMLYNNNRQNGIIGMQESVYRDSPIGNQERFSVKRISPLQQGFDSNILACISIGVHDNSAFLTFKEGIILTTVSLPNSTAVGTELGCMPRINDIQRNILVKAPLNKVLFKGKERSLKAGVSEPR